MMNVNMQDLKYQAVGLPDEVRMYHYAGDFAGELSCIDRWLARQVPDCLRKRLELQKLFAALRVEVFFLLLFGLLVFPFFGMDALAVWESVREGISNGVHGLLSVLYA